MPDRILVHGYLTVEGKKISKSGVSVDPFALVDRFGTDAVRHALVRHVSTTRDGDLDAQRIEAARTADLANGLGNLVGRVTRLVEQACGGVAPEPGELDEHDRRLLDGRAGAARGGSTLPSTGSPSTPPAAAIFEVVGDANRYVDRTTPWVAGPSQQRASRSSCERSGAIAHELTPFLPATAAAISARVGERVRHGPPLFPRNG